MDDKRIIVIEEVQDVFCYKKDSFVLDNKIFSMNDLNDLPLLLQSNLSIARKFLDNLALLDNVVLKSTYDLSSYSLVLSFVKEGLGVGFVNFSHVKDEINNGSLVILNTSFKIPKRKIGLCINKKITEDTVIKKFVEYIKK